MSEQFNAFVRDVERAAKRVLALLQESKRDEEKVLESVGVAKDAVKALQGSVGALFAVRPCPALPLPAPSVNLQWALAASFTTSSPVWMGCTPFSQRPRAPDVTHPPVDDVAVMVRANDEEQRAILDLLRDCLGSLKSSVAQIDTLARNELKALVRLPALQCDPIPSIR